MVLVPMLIHSLKCTSNCFVLIDRLLNQAIAMRPSNEIILTIYATLELAISGHWTFIGVAIQGSTCDRLSNVIIDFLRNGLW